MLAVGAVDDASLRMWLSVEFMDTQYDLLREPRGASYRDLMCFFAELADEALLVVRPGLLLSDRAHAILGRMRPSLLREREAREWPGTALLGDTARVLTFRVDAACAAILADAVEGLFDWQQPDAPEDLCLLRPGGAPCLVTIAHERDGYLELDEEEHACLLRRAPAIRDVLAGPRATSDTS